MGPHLVLPQKKWTLSFAFKYLSTIVFYINNRKLKRIIYNDNIFLKRNN